MSDEISLYFSSFRERSLHVAGCWIYDRKPTFKEIYLNPHKIMPGWCTLLMQSTVATAKVACK